MSEQIMNVINEIALKLGVAAEKVYPMLIKQADVFAATYRVTLWILFIAIAVGIMAYVGMSIADSRLKENMSVIMALIFCVACIVALISGINVAWDINEYITSVHNAEWWAIEYVIDLLK